MCRTLMGDPHLVIIDKPTEELSPQMVQRIASLIKEIANSGLANLFVGQMLAFAINAGHRVYVIGHDQVVFGGTLEGLRARDYVRK